MPGYVIHLAEAHLAAEQIMREHPYFKEMGLAERLRWKNAFLCGALLPDAAPKEQKAYSHFRNENDFEQAIVAPDLSLFLKEYTPELDQPLLCGYYAHLHLDQLFFYEFLPQYAQCRGENGEPEMRKENISSVYLPLSRETITPHQLLSQEYLYGDYTKLNHPLMQRYQLELPDYAALAGEQVCRIQVMALKEKLERLRGYLQSNEKENVKIFGMEQLKPFLEEAAEWWCNEIKRGK